MPIFEKQLAPAQARAKAREAEAWRVTVEKQLRKVKELKASAERTSRLLAANYDWAQASLKNSFADVRDLGRAAQEISRAYWRKVRGGHQARNITLGEMLDLHLSHEDLEFAANDQFGVDLPKFPAFLAQYLLERGEARKTLPLPDEFTDMVSASIRRVLKQKSRSLRRISGELSQAHDAFFHRNRFLRGLPVAAGMEYPENGLDSIAFLRLKRNRKMHEQAMQRKYLNEQLLDCVEGLSEHTFQRVQRLARRLRRTVGPSAAGATSAEYDALVKPGEKPGPQEFARRLEHYRLGQLGQAGKRIALELSREEKPSLSEPPDILADDLKKGRVTEEELLKLALCNPAHHEHLARRLMEILR